MKLNFITKMDLLTEAVSLRIGGKDVHKTYSGMVFTLIYISLLIAAFVKIFFYDFFDKTKPIVIQKIRESFEYPKADLYESQLAPAFSILDIKGNAIPIEDVSKYVTVSAILRKHDFGNDDSLDFSKPTSIANISVMPCRNIPMSVLKDLYSHLDKDPKLKKHMLNTGLCVNPKRGEWYVRGNITDTNITLIQINVQPCTLSPKECKSSLELIGIQAFIYGVKFEIDASNKDHPISPAPIEETPVYLDQRVDYSIIQYVKKNSIIDISGFLTQDSLKSEYIDVNKRMEFTIPRGFVNSPIVCDPIDIGNRTSCPNYLTYIYASSATNSVMERTYAGIFESLTDIGGIEQIISISVGFLYFLFRKFDFESDNDFLSEKIFTTKSNAEKHMKFITGNDYETMNKKDRNRLKKDIEDISQKNILHNLDVVTIITELNRVRILYDIIFPEELKQDEAILMLCLHRNDQIINEKKKKGGNGSDHSHQNPQQDDENIQMKSYFKDLIEAKVSSVRNAWRNNITIGGSSPGLHTDVGQHHDSNSPGSNHRPKPYEIEMPKVSKGIPHIVLEQSQPLMISQQIDLFNRIPSSQSPKNMKGSSILHSHLK